MKPGEPAPEDWLTPRLTADVVRQRSVRGVVVTTVRRVAVQGIQFAALLVLARLLTPNETGLVVMVTAVTGLAAMLAELQLTNLTVRRQQLSHAQCSNLFWLRLALNATAAVVLALLAPWLAHFYGDPRATSALYVLAISLPLDGLGAQHAALLRRNLRVVAAAQVAITSAVVTAAVSVAGAWWGLGYWALIMGALCASVAALLQLWRLCDWRPSLPQRGAGLLEMGLEGAQLSTFGVLSYLAGHTGQVMLGRGWGAAAAGLYARGANLQALMLSVLWEPLDSVAGPALARLRAEPERMARYYYRLATLLVTAAMPVIFLNLALPLDLVRVLLGGQWDASADVVRWLAVGALPTVIGHTASWVFFAVGDVRSVVRWGFIAWPSMIAATIAGSAFGPRGIAIAMSSAATALLVPCILTAFRATPLKLSALTRALTPAVCAAVLAAVPALIVLSRLDSVSELVRLVAVMSTFTLVYAGLLLTVMRQRPLFMEILVELRRRDAPSHG